MSEEYLPFYNTLNQKEKDFWLNCSKEELIDHLIANINNGEKLLKRIDKSIEIVNKTQMGEGYKKELLEILGGE